MPRHGRILIENGAYHLMARGNNRQAVFHDPVDYEKFLDILIWAKKKNPFWLCHYVLMPNHVHFLVRVLKSENLSKAMQRLFQGYSDYFRGKNSLVGHLWQGRYKSVALPTDKSLLLCGRYIELNPVRAGLCQSPEDYDWSSCRFYLRKGDSPLFRSLLDENPAYSFLGISPDEKACIYREILKRTEDDETIRGVMGLASCPGRPKKKGQSLF